VLPRLMRPAALRIANYQRRRRLPVAFARVQR